MDKLTPKQELFVQGIISGLSQRQAYRKAYKADHMKDETVDKKASLLFNKGEVRGRYRELLKQFSNMALWSREQAFNEYEWLKNEARTSIEQEGIRQANSNAFLAALEGMNDMAFRDLELQDEKLRAEIETIKTKLDDQTSIVEDDGFIKALEGEGAELWQEE